MENKATYIFRGIVIFCILFLSLYGCAMTQKYHVDVDVDSISSPDADSKKKYILLSGIKDVKDTDLQFDVKDTDLQFIEYTKYIETALISRGFFKANTIEDANVAIFLVYGMGKPQKNTYSYALPMWGQTGVSSSTTYGSLNTFGNTATYSGTTTYNPTYGITGFVPGSGSYVNYFGFLILDAVDIDEYKKSQKMNQLWQTTVTSTGSSGDLRLVFPVMVAASKEYLGLNTGKRIQIILSEEDQRVVEIKKVLIDIMRKDNTDNK